MVAFDDAASWVVSTQAVEDVAGIQDDIGTIRPGWYQYVSRTQISLRIFEGTKHSAQACNCINRRQSRTGNFQSLVQEDADHGITLSTVAVGRMRIPGCWRIWHA